MRVNGGDILIGKTSPMLATGADGTAHRLSKKVRRGDVVVDVVVAYSGGHVGWSVKHQPITPSTILTPQIKPTQNNQDASTSMRHQESGIVDRVVLTTNEKGFRFCKGA